MTIHKIESGKSKLSINPLLLQPVSARLNMRRYCLFLKFIACFFLFNQSSTSCLASGYKDKLGNYKWFEQTMDTVYTDNFNHIWYKVTDNKEKWGKAMIIRNANIYAMLDLGYDTMKVLRDVQLLNENSILFTRFSKLENYKEYIFYWHNAFNSQNFTFSARKSERISQTNLSLKFYSTKAGMTNAAALGLVKKGFFNHFMEASHELGKKYRSKLNRKKLEIYVKNYMHLNNAIELLNEKKLQQDIILETTTLREN